MNSILRSLLSSCFFFGLALADPPALTPAGGTPSEADLATKAPLASPAFTGTPTVPTATAGTNSTQAANTSFVQSVAATLANKPLGPFADDIAAAAGGVSYDQIYRKTGGTIAWRQKPVVQTLAIMGDSITEQNTNDLNRLNGYGYAVAARMFGGSKWDFEPNGSVLEFASGTFRTDQIITAHLSQVLASGADAVFVVMGTNDVIQSVSNATIVANHVSVWTQCRAAGIWPIGGEIPPIELSYGGNSGGVISARVVSANAALKAAALANNVPWIEWNDVLETTPGNGVLISTLSDDNLHPNRTMAMRMGREAAPVIAANFDLPYNPLADTDWENANVAFAGSSGQPTGWGAPFMPSGATLNSKTLVEAGDYDWWELNVTTTGITADMAFNNGASANLGGSPVGKLMETVMEVQVISGAFQVILSQTATGGSGTAYDVFSGGASPWADIVPADGVVILRTPAMTIGAGTTVVWPSVLFRCDGAGVIRFRRCGVRVR